MTDFRKRLRALAVARGCTMPGCTRAVHGIGNLCPSHIRARQVYGHPLARCPDRKTLSRYTEAASAYLHEQREHPGVRAALQWLDGQIAHGDYRTAQLGGRSDPRNAHQRADAFWAQLKHIGSRQVLSVIVGCYARQIDKPETFLDWEHFGATITYLLAHAMPAKITGRRSAGGMAYGDKARILPPRARMVWLAQCLPLIGPPARILAKRVLARMTPPPTSEAFADLGGET
mgnify:CR=1 FL=1